MDISLLVLIGLLVVVVGVIVSVFNNLVSKRNVWQNAFSQIEVQLKRRYDLIPNLVETAKGYMKHEQETLENVIAARNQASQILKAAAGGKGDIASIPGAEKALAGALGQLNVVMESYPDLKASANMQQLTEELTTTENKVSRARQFYNDAVTDYNTYRQSLPAVIFAGTFGHTSDASLLEFEDSQQMQAAPKVSF
ncbi:LemA family protein [Sansalvadorimonas verongulae]|uniref:LemA family protein n=1 Tax=Sansalvadorimonas verongulae TaxID=2172824 RepID=UPI0012BB59F6|nr:LemA family protein [Sansalvadorimonas verongulae]MTI12542.1 LemA family protein [Sansalvadorimonas verongulae]